MMSSRCTKRLSNFIHHHISSRPILSNQRYLNNHSILSPTPIPTHINNNKFIFNSHRFTQQKIQQEQQQSPDQLESPINPPQTTTSTSNTTPKDKTPLNPDDIQVTIQIIDDHLSIIQYNNKKIFLVGAAHSSITSAQQVREVIEEVQPETIILEICPDRAAHLQGQIKHFKRRTKDGHKVTASEKSDLLLGGEFRTAIAEGQRIGAKLIYADMDQKILSDKFKFGMKKAMENPNLSISDKLKIKLGCISWRDYFGMKWNQEATLNRMHTRENMRKRLEFMTEKAPALQLGVMDERNDMMSIAMRDCEGELVVAVVGQDHMEGIEERFRRKFEGVDERKAGKMVDKMMEEAGMERLGDLGLRDTWMEDPEFEFLKNARDLPQKGVKGIL